MLHMETKQILEGQRHGKSAMGWLGPNPQERIRQIQDGSLRMVIVFGTHAALRFWRDQCERSLIDSGACVHLPDVRYQWPSGAEIRLEVASSGDTRKIRGITFTDYEMDASIDYENRDEWQQMLKLQTRR